MSILPRRVRPEREVAPLSFCEPVWATPYSHEHIRRLNGPRKLGGGITGEALCGFDIARGWDLATQVTAERIKRGVQAEMNPTCPECAEIALREVS